MQHKLSVRPSNVPVNFDTWIIILFRFFLVLMFRVPSAEYRVPSTEYRIPNAKGVVDSLFVCPIYFLNIKSERIVATTDKMATKTTANDDDDDIVDKIISVNLHLLIAAFMFWLFECYCNNDDTRWCATKMKYEIYVACHVFHLHNIVYIRFSCHSKIKPSCWAWIVHHSVFRCTGRQKELEFV